jgi:hypothetical protein
MSACGSQPKRWRQRRSSERHMKKHNMTSYSFDGLQVTVEQDVVETVKVKVAKKEEE